MSDFLDNMGGEDDDTPTAPFWMTTFSDMATLLLTFFVMIVAMSEVEVKKFKEALSYFQGRTSFLSHAAVIPPPRQQIMAQKSEDAAEQEEQFEELLKYLEENDLADKVQVNMTEKGLHVVMSDAVMFRSGEADLIDPARSVLRQIIGLIDDKVKAVIVEGHTDDRPIRTSVFPSNWELSSARATSVVRQLIDQGVPPNRLVAAGFGEFQPIDPGNTEEAFRRNRRIELKLTEK